ncbi:MAG: dihydrouridine synthase [Opitutales bacterium]|nr:dihydrouridine synthase [Opitutales bacterium]
MQDVTSLPYMQVIASLGPPDYFFTEYFRVHQHSRLDPEILRSITENRSGRPVFAQIIGERPDDLRRTVRELFSHPIAGIDFNMGCPAPRVYRKNVGGGLLRNLADADRALGVLREAVPGQFTVKTRIGFEDDSRFDELLDLIEKHGVDLLSLHVRLVRDGYHGPARHHYGKRAVERLACPVLLNGDVSSAARAIELLGQTGAFGVMIGRGAIRNPWIFSQLRQLQSGQPVHRPTLGDVHGYVEQLYQAFDKPDIPEAKNIARMKKFLNFIGLAVDEEGVFLHQVRRARTRTDLFAVCSHHLLAEGRGESIFPDEPWPDLVARPNREGSSRSAPVCS